jgi:hypothetical protein
LTPTTSGRSGCNTPERGAHRARPVRAGALCRERGATFRRAAAALSCSASTAFEWVARWRRATLAERRLCACLADRSSRPRRLGSPGQGADHPGPPAQRLGAAPDRRRAVHGPLDGLEGARARWPLAARASRSPARAPLRVAPPVRSAAHRHQALCALRSSWMAQDCFHQEECGEPTPGLEPGTPSLRVKCSAS